jgi:purine-cytosine permease-like protein
LKAADVGPVPAAERTQSATDLFLIYAGANIAATTLQTGAALVPAFGTRAAFLLVAAGSVLGSAFVASLSPIGPRLGVPSVVAARAALGRRGADGLALLLYVTNFAWIALNNVIAASACVAAFGGDQRAWSFGLGIAATAVVAGGPRAVGLADRAAVPLMATVGGLMLWRCFTLGPAVLEAPGQGGVALPVGFDIVVGYQVSWVLMFADYSRYTASARRGASATFLALASTSLWFMPIGVIAARTAGSSDPGAMVQSLGLGAPGAVLMAFATVTTNFVNIYLSGLAWKSLLPRTPDQVSLWTVGLIGSLLSLFSGVLDRYADFMLVIGGLLVPVGGILVARFFLHGEPVDVEALYDASGPYRGFALPAMAAWAVGALVYFACARLGGTLPSLASALLVYQLTSRRR